MKYRDDIAYRNGLNLRGKLLAILLISLTVLLIFDFVVEHITGQCIWFRFPEKDVEVKATGAEYIKYVDELWGRR